MHLRDTGTVGGQESAAGNVISGTSNQIFANAGLGIDLLPNNVTPNDGVPDADAGPNDLQNFPVLGTAVVLAVGATSVTWDLSSVPLTQYRVEFFVNANCDGLGHGEGRKFLGAVTVTTDTFGKVAAATQLPATTAGVSIAATATVLPVAGSTGPTSEFSACEVVV